MTTPSGDPQIPTENLQEVNLDDDSDSSSEGEPETWDDEGNDGTVPAPAPAPAPAPIPILDSSTNATETSPSTTTSTSPHRGGGGGGTSSSASSATVVRDMPPPPPPVNTSPNIVKTYSKNNNAPSKPIRAPAPPKSQRQTGATMNNKQQQQQHHHRKRHPRQEDEDVSSRAAVALAAVAAAATANNSSPSAAAQAARAVAQSFVRANRGGGPNANNHPNSASNNNNNHPNNSLLQAPPKPKPILPVKLELVKEQLLELCTDDDDEDDEDEEQECDSSNERNTATGEDENAGVKPQKRHRMKYPFVERLAHGENDAFLQHLLLIAYFRAIPNEFPTGAELRPTVAIIDDNVSLGKGMSPLHTRTQDPNSCEIVDPDVELAEEAANAALSIWKSMEGAYTSMVAMLPRTPNAPHSSLQQHQKHLKPGSSFENKVLEVPSLGSTPSTEEPSLSEDGTSDISATSSLDNHDNALNDAGFGSHDDCDFDEPERPVVVPDLLPPCTSARGDVTIEFFRACQGKTHNDSNADDENPDDSSPSSPARNDKSSPDQSLSASTRSPPSPSSKFAGGATSVLSSMFSAATRRNSAGTVGSNLLSPGGIMNVKMPTAGFNVFRKSAKNPKAGSSDTAKAGGSNASNTQPGEYAVTIEREMLGLTVENVLERTVVRTVLAGGPAKKAGAKVGSLIVKVGSVETKNLTHFETIDELRQSQRPLQLVLRLISDDALRSAREEMGRLIRGSGFGIISGSMDLNSSSVTPEQARAGAKNGASPQDAGHHQHRGEAQGRPLIAADLRIEAYSSTIRKRFFALAETKNKKEETLEHATEKLVWILNLFVIGLQHESARLFALAGSQENPQDDGSSVDLTSSPRRVSSGSHGYHHTAKDYADAAKSVAKILLDFVKKNLDPGEYGKKSTPDYNSGQTGLRGRRKGPPSPENANRRQPLVPGMQSTPQSDSTILHDKPLLQIGDVLHRTRSFLADPTSPPAALLRGELIAFLCDVLDIDTDMELSEEEAVTATAGGKAGPITDLGSAGSLLKLIVLNCSIMRSPECESVSSPDTNKVDPEMMNEMRRRFGGRAKLDGADVHRLHAGNRFLSVVHRLAASRSTSARITACSLGPVLWGHLDFPHQLQLRGVITRALHDAEVIVRKSTATVLHEIAELIFDQRAVPWLILMCERAMTDPEPQLRSAAMTLTWHLAEHLPNAFLGDASQGSRFLRRLPNRSDPVFADVYLLQCKLLPVATRLAEDRAPSVRLAVAAQCDRLCSSLGDHWSSVIIDVLLALLTDADERVRCEAVLCVPRLAEMVLMASAQTTPGMTKITDVSVLESLLPASLMLQKDKIASVRVALATAAGELLTLLVGLQSLEEIGGDSASEPPAGSGKLKRHVDDVLIPLVQKLLHDKDPEVTSSALRAVTNASRGTVREIRPRQLSMASADDDASVSSHLSLNSRDNKKDPVFLPVLSEDQVLRLLPTLAELGNSKQWRVRQSAVEIVPALLGCTRNMETRREISQLCLRLMDDQVDAVRRTAAECLCLGGGSLGSHGEGVGAEWITSIVIPHVRRCAAHANAKQRLLSLKMIEVVLLNGACPAKWKGDEEGERLADSPMRELAVIALSMSKDKVPNVRLNVGRVLESAIHVFEEDALGFIKEVLMQQLAAEKERPGGGDRDVLFFASRCIQKARVILEEVSFPSTEELLNI